ncbi:MAG: cache domain-containing protein [Gammaproteobacteria bacterium]|nr:cache domain-containing protein [Gammaproteobacteria bacterium]
MLRLLSAIRTTVRYKLLALVLFPILLLMPIALAVAVYWGASFTYEQLFIKVNTDLSVAHDLFRRIQQDYLDRLATQAESHTFSLALEVENGDALRVQIDALRKRHQFSYLNLLDRQGKRMLGREGRARSSPLYLRAMNGSAAVGIEIFSAQELQEESQELAAAIRLPLIATPRARPTNRSVEMRGMMIRALYPIKDSRGELVALLDGGVLLNGNFEFVDAIRDLVYGPGSLPQGSIGTVTVFMDDVRITTNVPLRPGERALGTRVSEEVRSRVLDQGKIWIDRAFVVNDWYISSYEPIIDAEGERVGMLYAGFLESPSRSELWRALTLLVLMFVLLMLLSSLVAVTGAKSIFRPLEAMSKVVHAVRDGKSGRIGSITSTDEIGILAREFDSMLELLQQRSDEIQSWADQLEEKVSERTAELESKNDDLRRTIRVLRKTRRQLVAAEKLAALGELTAGVAHEINNPTAVILGNLDVMVAELGDQADPVRREIGLIIEQIDRIRDIINNLLQYARPGEFSSVIDYVDINHLIEGTTELVQHLQKISPFEIRLDLRATRPVRINQAELQQVLVNLLVNAIHALDGEAGTLDLESEDWNDKGVKIHVRDSGSGMDEAQLGQIFNPFYSTKDQGQGTGLGLSVSYSIIRRYGGNLTVSSTPGEGSRFSIWLLDEPQMVEDEETIIAQLHSVGEG